MPTRLRALAGTALATAGLSAALVLGPGAGTARADVLDDIAHEYSTGTSGGQVSNLVRTSLQLRAKGAQVSSAQNDALKAALDKRPSQMPLINTLKSVIATQTQFLKAAQKPQQPVHIASVEPTEPTIRTVGLPTSTRGRVSVSAVAVARKFSTRTSRWADHRHAS
ncbi:Uncharacterised protein [Mycobacteroides abscessus]|nr:Uncharacterised protein [Mycobacteroides abscessus]